MNVFFRKPKAPPPDGRAAQSGTRVETRGAIDAPAPGLHLRRRPPTSLPLRFILAGVSSFLTGTIWLAARPEAVATYHYNQYVIAFTHLFVLGWLMSAIIGAVYQLVPVALETELYSVRLARWHFWLHLIGFAGMVWSFWRWDLAGVGHFGSLLALGLFLFIYNIARTLARTPRWTLTATGVASALAWLCAAFSAGLYLAADKCWHFSPFDPIAQMHAHAHIGIAGFMLILLVGASYKLAPMFALSEIQNRQRAGAALWLMNAGLASSVPAILWQWKWRIVPASVLAAGVAVYLWEMAAIVAARKRRALDWGLISFFSGISLLAPLCAAGLFLAWPALPLNAFTGQMENAYGILAVLGALSLAIMGMLFKIVPFLVWQQSYSRAVGRKKVPTLGELYSARLQAVSFFAYGAGLIATLAAALLQSRGLAQIGAGILAAGVALFAANIALILRHLAFPKMQPFIFSEPLASAPAGIGVR